MIVHLKIVGSVCIALALSHIIFPFYFNWKQDLKSISLLNRQLMHVHTFFIAIVVFLIGILCVTSPEALLETQLGNRLALGLFIFWGLRLLFQFFVYSSKLWLGKPLETGVHVLFSLLWIYFSGVFFVAFWIGPGI